ncbi:serine/threonine protein kinase [Archangium lansingense]|uniref:serine/threonine protein kinase n=1 Tax=Archangium lansingense TaxID=2995310 RepID=UPI003B7705A3
MTEALHPDHLQPDDMVGPWRIVQVVGRGGSSRVFKVEREGVFYSMKVALLPLSDSREELSEEEYVEERSAYRKLAREAAALFTYASHPNLLRVYAVDFWPDPRRGYPYLVTDFIDGDNWHQWRWRKPPHAAGLVDTFSSVVRTVGVLHERGVHHRDLKAENILIRSKDGRPFLIDFGTARLPGALTKTMGLPEGVLHLLPPELLAYTRTEAWKRNESFHGGVPADLYALGVLLYQALTDLHPFDPELPDEQLVAAIAAVPPTAPHLLNPLAPHSLSGITMKLLEKKPEDRYPSTQALLQALDQAAEQERSAPAWKVPLTQPDSSALEESKEQAVPPREAEPETQAAPPSESAPSQEGTQQEGVPPPARGTWRGRWPLVLLAGLTVLGLALWLLHSTLAPPPEALPPGTGSEKGNPPVSTRSTPSSLLAAWLCAVVGIGCPAAQVKPPAPEDCPKEVTERMFREWMVQTGRGLRAIVDINQPGDFSDVGTYQEGPVIGRLVEGAGGMPEGTILHGHLWTGPGIYEMEGEEKSPAVLGRYTLAVLPDGQKHPVCLVLGGDDGRVPTGEGSKPGAVRLPRELPVSAVWRWP